MNKTRSTSPSSEHADRSRSPLSGPPQAQQSSVSGPGNFSQSPAERVKLHHDAVVPEEEDEDPDLLVQLPGSPARVHWEPERRTDLSPYHSKFAAM